MKILILGCGGFIGSHLIDRLLKEEGYDILGFDVSDYKIQEHLNQKDRFKFIKKDIYKNLNALYTAIKYSDAVIFLASICNPALYVTNSVETIRSNFIRPSKIVDLCTELDKWLINFSTCEVYGKTISGYTDNPYSDPSLYVQNEDKTPSLLGPIKNFRWSYASAKQLLDRYIYGQHIEKNLSFTTIRPYNFFGARMDYLPDKNSSGIPRVLACFMDALINDKPIKLVNGGKAYRVITYIDDAINAVLKILENRDKAVGQIFNIGNPDNEVTVRELAEKMRAIYARRVKNDKYLKHPIEDVDGSAFYGRGYEDCDRRMPDISKAKNLLNWEPEYGIEDTLEKAIKFFMEFYGIK